LTGEYILPSPDNTLIGPGQSITDAAGNVWTITANSQVAVNGQADPTTENVTHLAYAGGLVWQENTNNLWWSKASSSASWSPTFGTAIAPIPLIGVSSNYAVIGIPAAKAASPVITDQSANTWSITNGQVAVNGVIDQSTANVIELAYVNGQIWQENSAGLWWSKSTPADGWGQPSGTTINPLTGPFNILNAPGDQAIINVGELTASPLGAAPPGSTAEVVTPSIVAHGIALDISTATATVVVNGSSTLTQNAMLTVIGAYRAPSPVYGPVENNGAMALDHSTAHIGALSGRGSIIASNGSALDIQSSSGDTIQLVSSHLYIGGQGSTDPTVPHGGPPGGMSFLAPIIMDGASTITLYNTQATTEVLNEFSGSVDEVLLYNGSVLVADLKVSGVSRLYATETGFGSSSMVTLSAVPNSQNLPITNYSPDALSI
jgi:hypothetical protein